MHGQSVRKAYIFGKSGYRDAIYTVAAYASCTGDSITIVRPQGTITLTEGVDWTAATSNTATATSLAAAIAAKSGFSSTAVVGSQAKVYVFPDDWVEVSDYTTSDATNLTLADTQTDYYVSVAAAGTRTSNPIFVEAGENFAVAVKVTVDGAGTPSFELDYRMAQEYTGIDGATGAASGVTWGPWTEVASAVTGSDGDWFEYAIAPPVGGLMQFKFTNNDASNAITASTTTGLKGLLKWY